MFSIFNCILKQFGKAAAIEDIIPKDKTSRIVTNKLFSNDECLSKAIG